MKKPTQINLGKLIRYLLKRSWLILLCAAIGYGLVFWYAGSLKTDTYTACGTLFVYNRNPNLANDQYTSTGDLTSAVQLVDTYMAVAQSNRVLDVVAENLAADYPGITSGDISDAVFMDSVSDTGVLRVNCRTDQAQLSADICNAVLEAAPAEILRVVGAGRIEIIDRASVPLAPDGLPPKLQAVSGAWIGAALAAGLLLALFLMDRSVDDSKELWDNYSPPVLASIRRVKQNSQDPSAFLLSGKSAMETIDRYAKLRMNLMYILSGKKNNAVVITSAVAGEGKSAIAANLAISCAMGGKRVLLVDGDLRHARQGDDLNYPEKSRGLSDVLAGRCSFQEAVTATETELLHVLPAGKMPPHPAELMGSDAMRAFLKEARERYDLILLDVPPVNTVPDPLALSAFTAGCLFVVRQGFSDHREVRKALIAAGMTGMEVLGFVFFGENLRQDSRFARGNASPER